MDAGLIVTVLFMIAFLFPLWALFEAAGTPDEAWERAGYNKVLWVVLLIFLSIFAALAYVIAIRPKLRSSLS